MSENKEQQSLRLAKQRKRNWIIFALLIGFVLFVYLLGIVQMRQFWNGGS